MSTFSLCVSLEGETLGFAGVGGLLGLGSGTKKHAEGCRLEGGRSMGSSGDRSGEWVVVKSVLLESWDRDWRIRIGRTQKEENVCEKSTCFVGRCGLVDCLEDAY